MNLPNKLSLLRAILMPVCVVLTVLSAPFARWAALGVFCVAAFTDFLDGQIARRQHLITDFGKFMDPVADKMLVLGVMCAMVDRRMLPFWVLLCLIARDLAVDGLRLVAAGQGKVIAAGKLGKIKTVSQMILILWLYVFPATWQEAGLNPGRFITFLSVLLTLYSGADYLWRNRAVLTGGKDGN